MTLQIIRFNILLLILLTDSALITSISAQQKKLTFNQVYMFSEPRILKSLPKIAGWFDDRNYLITKSENGKLLLMKVRADDGDEEILLDYSAYDNTLIEYDLTLDESIANTTDYTGFLFKKNNDYYFFSRSSEKMVRLTTDNAEKKNPTLSPDGKKVAYTKNRDLYYADTETGKEYRLTYDASETIYNGWASWVYMEEILGRSGNSKAFWWSPNSEMIAFLNTDDSPVPKFPLYRADGIYGEIEWEHYPKPGDANPDVKLGIVHLSNKQVVWVDEDEAVDQYTAWPFWTPDSRQLFYQVLNRGQDHLQILSADPKTGKSILIYEERQSTWVEFFEDIVMLEDMSGFIMRSDKDDFHHLYYYDLKGNLKARLTSGSWTVKKIVFVDKKKGKVFFEANKKFPLETHLFSVGLDGKGIIRLTSAPGTHSTSFSPEGSFFYSTYTSADTPHKVELFDSDGGSVRLLFDRRGSAYDEYDLGTTEFFDITTEDGLLLHAMWVLPPDFDETKKYPVLLSVYGSPGRNDVTNSFSAYLDRYFVAQSGIIYFVVDHRGSLFYGGKGKEYMYRNLGRWEMNDYIQAVKWLRKKPFIDESRIAITGSSYGGYLACMALTFGSDYFTHGIADFSVTDWRLYDNVYTERYMDKPEENPEGYKFGSAMTHASNYKGMLRLTHGTMDDNVHMQNTLQLVDKLTTFNKDFELMIYPNERHGVGFPKWAHLQREYIKFLYRYLLNKEFTP